MGRIGFGELVLIFAIVVLIVGAKRLPEIARAVGQSVREFKRALKDDHDKPEKP